MKQQIYAVVTFNAEAGALEVTFRNNEGQVISSAVCYQDEDKGYVTEVGNQDLSVGHPYNVIMVNDEEVA